MYTDYEVKYVSNINEYIIPILIGVGLLIALCIVNLIALSKIFKKANRSGIYAFIPIYNLIVLCEIINKPKWKAIILWLPIINIKDMFALAKAFRKTDLEALLAAIFPFVFIPIIGFGSSEYMGLNKEAMTGKSIAIDVPILTEKDTVAEEVRNVNETKPIDISLGGGVYQKEYKNSLIDVPEEEINIEKLASFRVEEKEEVQEEVKETKSSDLFSQVNYVKPVQESVNNIITNVEEKQVERPDLLASGLNSNVNRVEQTIPTELNNINMQESVSNINTNVEEKQVERPDLLASGLNSNVNRVEQTIPTELNKINMQESVNNINTNVEEKQVERPDLLATNNSIGSDRMNDFNDMPKLNIEDNSFEKKDDTELIEKIQNMENNIINTNSQMNSNQILNVEEKPKTTINTDTTIAGVCPNCGFPIKAGTTKCFMCGKDIK